METENARLLSKANSPIDLLQRSKYFYSAFSNLLSQHKKRNAPKRKKAMVHLTRGLGIADMIAITENWMIDHLLWTEYRGLQVPENTDPSGMENITFCY